MGERGKQTFWTGGQACLRCGLDPADRTFLGAGSVGHRALVRLLQGPPVFFRQTRPGYRGRPFQLVKFRSMTDKRDAGGDLLPDGERISSIGRFLRQSSLDELPELFNVLRGEMSLVGPRP